MLSKIRSALRSRAAELGQGKAEFILILAPLSAVLALSVCTLIIAGSR